MLNFNRIEHLISQEELQKKIVLQVGLGSGGAPVNQHLTMNGVQNWILFDPDVYDDLNLVKHPYLRNQIGLPKADIQKEWILDRNPSANVQHYQEDILKSSIFEAKVKTADLILCCVDKYKVRSFINSVAVGLQKPCITASVYRQGYGGEVYCYLPKKWGCFDCMDRTATENGWNIDDSIEPTDDEKKMVYGLNISDYKSSGLSLDIQTIAILQARMALDLLTENSKKRIQPNPVNWIVFHNRPIPNTPKNKFLDHLFFALRPRKDCRCAQT